MPVSEEKEKTDMAEDARKQIRGAWADSYGTGGEIRMYFAPGRVNLIGEHTDYNGGHVFPCALTLGTWAAVRCRTDSICRFYSLNFAEQGILETDIGAGNFSRTGTWIDYPLGVMDVYRKHGFSLPYGFDMLVYGTIPGGAGLSSSASLEVLTAFILQDQYGFTVDKKETAVYCREAENEFVGMNCGIMDQFAVAFGKQDYAVFLDTASLDYEYVPVQLGTACLVIANTNKKHKLTDSAYNDRRRECEEALARIREIRGSRPSGEKTVRNLCGMTPEEFEEIKDAIGDPVLIRRARHAVYENARTEEAVKVLKAGDLKRFGELMKASHRSLAEDYMVTGKELDTLAYAAWEQPGCIGSRMTGGGFGGSTVSLVERGALTDFMEKTGDIYKKETGIDADFYIAEIGSGPVRTGVL